MKPGLMALMMSAKKAPAEKEEASEPGTSMKKMAGDELASSLGLSGGKAKAFLSALESYIQCCGGDD